MDSSCRARFLRTCRRAPGLKRFLDCYGEDVRAVDVYGESLLTHLSGSRLVAWALLLGWKADVVDDGRYPCIHSPLYEACDCGRWAEVLLMLRRPLRREALASALYWACQAWDDEHRLALPALRGLIEQLGGFDPERHPRLMQLLILGGVYPLIPQALAAGYELPPASWWAEGWEEDEGAWSSGDMRYNHAWRRALERFAATSVPLLRSDCHLPRRSRRFKKQYTSRRREREWLQLLRSCC